MDVPVNASLFQTLGQAVEIPLQSFSKVQARLLEETLKYGNHLLAMKFQSSEQKQSAAHTIDLSEKFEFSCRSKLDVPINGVSLEETTTRIVGKVAKPTQFETSSAANCIQFWKERTATIMLYKENLDLKIPRPPQGFPRSREQ
jgi:hypothetical protein